MITAFGNGLLYSAGLACLLAIVFYGRSAFQSPQHERVARQIYVVFSILVIGIAVLLLTQIIGHNFGLDYVYSYSSVSLSPFLLISTFWAGQVGTFLLWLVYTVVVGLFLMRSSWIHRPRLMFFYMLIPVFLMTLLIARSPFAPTDLAAHQIPAQALPLADGRGLNPLLQNFWMVIHPPIVFLGFTLLGAPFAFALAALSANDFSNWTKAVFPWTLVGLSVLGLGIFLGGYWAYETLGWGGYWAWDPVENSSFIPWLVSLALVHGLLIERARGALRKTNLLLALLGYLMVMYGTFLTRSGVLQEFSVHSFTDLGINAYLILFMGGFVLLSAVLFLIRAVKLRTTPRESNAQAWFETFVILGALFTILLMILTWVGTSAPLITTLLAKPANVNQSYYNTVAFPIALVMALLVSLASVFIFIHKGRAWFTKQMVISVVVGVLGILTSLMLGVRHWRDFVLIGTALFTVTANVLMLFAIPKRTWFSRSGNLAHIGFGILLIGFVGSNSFATTTGVIKLQGLKSQEAFNMDLRFIGMGDSYYDPNNTVKVEVTAASDKYVATPRFYQDPYFDQTVINPYIRKGVFSDTYFSPQKYLPNYRSLELGKGDSAAAFGYTFTFQDFDMTTHAEGEMPRVGAIISVKSQGFEQTVVPYFSGGPQGGSDYAPIYGTDYSLYVDRILADEGKVVVDVVGVGDLVLEVSRKPLINLVWFGAIVIVLASLLSFWKRRKLAASQAG